MDKSKYQAIQITKEIVVSKMSSSTVPTNKDGGKSVAEFFEEIYNKVYEIISKDE